MSDEYKNKRFYENLFQFVIKSIEKLKPYFNNPQYYSLEKDYFYLNNIPQRRFIPMLFTPKLIRSHLSEINQEYEKCIQCMEDDERISRHNGLLMGASGRSPFEYLILLEKILSLMIDDFRKKNEIDKNYFNEIYKQTEDFLYSDVIHVSKIIPLLNFNMDIEKISVNEKVEIRKIVNEEKLYWLENFGFFEEHNMEISHTLNFVIEIQYEVEKFTENGEYKGNYDDKLLENLITSLRLFKKGAFGYSRIEDRPAFFLFGPTSYSPFCDIKLFDNMYVLCQNEVPNFREVWTTVNSKLMNSMYLQMNKDIEISLKRFNILYQRLELSDKYVDLMISFESLFYKKDEHDELRFRLGLRVAKILETEFKKRRDLAKFMKDCYDLRSKILHGEAYNLSDIRKSFEKLENIYRNSILYFLNHSQNHKDIIEEIDFS